MNLDSARKTFGSFPQLLSLKPSYAADGQASPAGFMMPGLTWWYEQLCFELHPSQSLSTCLHQGTPSILNPKRWRFLSERLFLSVFIWRLGFYIKITDCFAALSSHCNVFTEHHEEPVSLKYTSHSPHSLPWRWQEEPHVRVRHLRKSNKWYSLKQGHWPIWFSEPLNFPRQCLNTMKTCPASTARKE